MDKMTEAVKNYYGKELRNRKDLKTDSCCCGGNLPPEVRETLPLIADEIKERFYGCGSPLPAMKKTGAREPITSSSARSGLTLPLFPTMSPVRQTAWKLSLSSAFLRCSCSAPRLAAFRSLR